MDPRISELLEGFPVIVEVPVFWADMDYFRHVNNTVFFRWFEVARIAYLERIGFADGAAHCTLGPIVASTYARFRRPVFHPDTIYIGARAADLSTDRFTNEYRAVSEKQQEIVAEGGAVVVSYDYATRTKAPLPAAVREMVV